MSTKLLASQLILSRARFQSANDRLSKANERIPRVGHKPAKEIAASDAAVDAGWASIWTNAATPQRRFNNTCTCQARRVFIILVTHRMIATVLPETRGHNG